MSRLRRFLALLLLSTVAVLIPLALAAALPLLVVSALLVFLMLCIGQLGDGAAESSTLDPPHHGTAGLDESALGTAGMEWCLEQESRPLH